MSSTRKDKKSQAKKIGKTIRISGKIEEITDIEDLVKDNLLCPNKSLAAKKKCGFFKMIDDQPICLGQADNFRFYVYTNENTIKSEASAVTAPSLSQKLTAGLVCGLLNKDRACAFNTGFTELETLKLGINDIVIGDPNNEPGNPKMSEAVMNVIMNNRDSLFILFTSNPECVKRTQKFINRVISEGDDVFARGRIFVHLKPMTKNILLKDIEEYKARNKNEIVKGPMNKL